jgi:UDP-N-acetylmuramate: L-alanyl-gamma-D-glutamyl-meso-diaminopimelate ligase
MNKRLYFLGICGSAVGNVAIALKQLGYHVRGSDRAAMPPMGERLEESGIAIDLGYDTSPVPDDVDLFVIGNVISRGNEQLEAILDRRLPYCSLPEFLRYEFLRKTKNVVISGTYGKTTTASLLAYILRAAELRPSWFLGGTCDDLPNGALFDTGEPFVVEGDEYDTCFYDKGPKFAHYLPALSVIMDVDEDQKDVYQSIDEVKIAFDRLLRVTPSNAPLFYSGDCADSREMAEKGRSRKKISVGLQPGNDIVPGAIERNASGVAFTLWDQRFETQLFGDFNIKNAVFACAVAKELGVPLDVIAKATASFRGVRRRMEVKGEYAGVTVVDDFGKHPENIGQTLKAARSRFPNRRIVAVVEPKTATMCHKDMQPRLVAALTAADVIFFCPLERPERFGKDTIVPEELCAELREAGRKAVVPASLTNLTETVASQAQAGDVIIGFSSGDIGGFYESIGPALMKKFSSPKLASG